MQWHFSVQALDLKMAGNPSVANHAHIPNLPRVGRRLAAPCPLFGSSNHIAYWALYLCTPLQVPGHVTMCSRFRRPLFEKTT